MASTPRRGTLGGSNKLLSLPATADLLDVSPRRLRDNWESWGLPGFRVGQSIRFRERDVQAWIETRRIGPRRVTEVAS